MSKPKGKVSSESASATAGKLAPLRSSEAAAAASLEATATTPAADVGPALVIFGRDEKGNGHAAWFAAPEAELAERAAAMMGYSIVRVTSEVVRARALELTAGKIFGSGKALAPFCRMPLLEALESFPGAFKPQAQGAGTPRPPEAVIGMQRHGHGQNLRVGAVVLATVGEGEGWYEARIAEGRGEALYVLTWRDWPDDGTFVRRADALALLPTKAAPAG